MTTQVEPSATAQLVLRARAGDRDAFGDLAQQHWSQLVALARGILAGDTEAEDVVQDALIHAWQRLRTLRRPERFAAWMRKIVTRRSLDRIRARKPVVEDVVLSISDPSPGDRIDAARLLGALAPRQRAALFLTWIEGCTDREAAQILGMRPSTVRVHRHRGMQRLRELVEKRR